MKYHVISTSKTGHGAIFTNSKEAKEYMEKHSETVYTVLDKMPVQITIYQNKNRKTNQVNHRRTSG